MDHNDILKAHREGRLSACGLDDLREMRRICARHLQSRNDFLIHPCEAVEREIENKQDENRRKETLEPKDANDSSSDHWHQKPVGKVILAIVATVIAALILYVLGI